MKKLLILLLLAVHIGASAEVRIAQVRLSAMERTPPAEAMFLLHWSALPMSCRKH